jgi:hypothetical protein
MSAMSAGDIVIRSERGTGSGCDRLLAQVKMDESRQLAGGEQVLDAVFKKANFQHPLEHQDERLS